jgi:hypothetical protein
MDTTKPPLTDIEKHERKRFVKEYLLDTDAKGACIRLGYSKTAAAYMSKVFMEDKYVLQLIMEYENNPSKQSQRRRDWYDHKLTQLIQDYDTPASVKVAAIGKHMELYNERSKPNSDALASPVVTTVNATLADHAHVIINRLLNGEVSVSLANEVIVALSNAAKVVESTELLARLEALEEIANG